MTGKEWRREVERFVENLEHELSWESTPKENESSTERLFRAKAEAEIRVFCATSVINSFKDKFLDRETADDFDEV